MKRDIVKAIILDLLYVLFLVYLNWGYITGDHEMHTTDWILAAAGTLIWLIITVVLTANIIKGKRGVENKHEYSCIGTKYTVE